MSRNESHSDIGVRVAEVMGNAGLGVFASVLGVNPKTVTRWLEGKTVPDGASLLALAERYNVDPMWLLTGHGRPFRADANPSELPFAYRAPADQSTRAHVMEPRPHSYGATSSADMKVPVIAVADENADYVIVPRLAARPSAGTGGGPDLACEQLGAFAFARDWMRQHLGCSSGDLASVKVQGDSMEPTLAHGDEIVVDCSRRQVESAGVYVFLLRGELLVKRVQRRLDGALLVKSDNPAYEPEIVSSEKGDQLEVVGRVVWPRVR